MIGIVVTASLAVNGVVLSRSGSDSTSAIPAQIQNESGADALGARVGGGGKSKAKAKGGGGSKSRASRSSERRPSVERPRDRQPSVERPSSRPSVERPVQLPERGDNRPGLERPVQLPERGDNRPGLERPVQLPERGDNRPGLERPIQLPEIGDNRPGLERPVQLPERGDRRQKIRDRIADRIYDRIIVYDYYDYYDDTTYVFLDQQFLTERVIVILISSVEGATGDVEVWLNSETDPAVLVANALVDGLSELATYTLCVDSLLMATDKTDEQGTLFLEGAAIFTGGTISGLTASILEGSSCDANVSMKAAIP